MAGQGISGYGPPTPPMPGPPPSVGFAAGGPVMGPSNGSFIPGQYASMESRAPPQGTAWSPGQQQQSTGPQQEIPPWMMPQISGWGGASYQFAHEEWKDELPKGVDWGPTYGGELMGGRMAHKRGAEWATCRATGVHGTYKYKAVPGDEVDELVEEYLEVHPNPVKLVRTGPGRYIWGRHRLAVKLAEAKKGNKKLKLSTNGGMCWESFSKFFDSKTLDEMHLMLCAHPPNCGIAYEPWMTTQRWPAALGAPPHKPTIPFGQQGWLASLTCPIIRTAPASGVYELMPMIEPAADPRRPWN